MTLRSHRAEAINRMCGRVQSTLLRCSDDAPCPITKSLRLLIPKLLKEALSKGHMGHAEIHPSNGKMAKWAGCSSRHVRRHIRALEVIGFMVPVSHQKGGKRAVRYWVEPEALIRFMMASGANPHPDLVAEIRDETRLVRGDMRPDIRADTCPAICPPVYSNTQPSVSDGIRRKPSHGGDDV